MVHVGLIKYVRSSTARLVIFPLLLTLVVVLLPKASASDLMAEQTHPKFSTVFAQTFNLGADGMPGIEMAPLSGFFGGTRIFNFFKVSDAVIDQAVEVLERMDHILERCRIKMTFAGENLKSAFPRLTNEMQSFYNMIDEFKAQSSSVEDLLPKIRPGVEHGVRLVELVENVNRRLDLADFDAWFDLKEQRIIQFRWMLDLIPYLVEEDLYPLRELGHAVSIAIDFQVKRIVTPIRNVLFGTPMRPRCW